MPRLLHIITSLAVGGAQRHLLQLLPGLETPDNLDLIYFRDDDLVEAVAPLVGRLRRLPMGGVLGPAWLPALAAAIEEGRYDLVHTHLLRADMYGALAARLAGVRWVVSTKHNVEQRLASPVWRAAHRSTARLVDRTIAISAAVAGWAVRTGGVLRHAVRVIPYGIEPRPFQAVGRAAARNVLGLPPDALVVLCPARVDPQKDHATLLRAFARTRARLPAALLLLAGGPQLAAPRYAEGLRLLAADLGLRDAVQWLGVRTDMPALMAASDVVTLSSRWEGLGLAILEAMAAGRPVVATAVGGARELVVDGVTGYLVPAGDPEALSTALQALLEEPDRARKLGLAGAERVRARFSPARMQAATCAVYAELGVGGDSPS
ncbi:MAG: glycosyltransferase [Actinobacteria bacterium]|nr:glycosyltransferase [Actinomycetota bacterium]